MAYSKAAILALLWIILIAQSLGLLHIAGRDTHRRNVFDGDAAWFFFPVVELKVPVALQYVSSWGKWTLVFVFLLLFRYVRLLVNILGFWAYRPTPLPKLATITAEDVTVIVPTIDLRMWILPNASSRWRPTHRHI